MPSADFCVVIGSPCDKLSPVAEARRRSPEVSPTAFTAHLPDLPAPPLDGLGLRDHRLARPGWVASYRVPVRQVAALLHTSFRPRLATTRSCFANPSPPSGWIEDFHLQAVEHARHTDRIKGLLALDGVQYLSIQYSERLADAGIEPSVGSIGDSYDNALAETVIGLFKAEVIHRRGAWKTPSAVAYATLAWVDWFNHRRLLEPIGFIPPVEAEATYFRELKALPTAAQDSTQPASGKPGAVQR